MGHHHHHGHDHHGHSHSHFEESREGNKKGLLIALLITTGIMFLEFFGGLFTNSLALLSDSGHMLSDASALFLSLVAIWFASKAPSPHKTFGGYRFEILAALFNGITLFIIAGFIVWEAFGRFFEPQAVASGTMMLIAAIGLFANLLSAWALMRKGDVKNNVNLRGAYLHVLGDALGSIGAIVAGILMLLFDWFIADPIISVLVALLILRSAWGLIKHSVHILMEGTPISIDQTEVKAELEKIEGVNNVHDLHIWTITSGLDSLSCHLVIHDERNSQRILQQAIDKLQESFHIEHATIQIETVEIKHGELKCHLK
ncbi:cation diffusion facilitator family transporter [Psychrobacillus sp. OK032]|uniref:cation diffusion facilitator family transporter n=1 Tax=Psychrobacillus sp. OK032 TaxID=1884358 RepID=UPI0008D627FB|nr:cation diffusion facilitator family transporter [Psychrobacillus sp. OK032]SER99192.1 cobalt-zinc-cadmium efflux system protein [Psychrobacillus sp. OK032]